MPRFCAGGVVVEIPFVGGVDLGGDDDDDVDVVVRAFFTQPSS